MEINQTVFTADGAKVVGKNITIGEGSGIWYNCVVRCDERERITIEKKTNIQDLSMVHTAPGVNVVIGSGVSIGHMCLIHGCAIGDDTLVGMGSIIMNRARIGSRCVIGAGSLVTEGTVIPDGTVAFGRPAKVVRAVTEEEIAGNRARAERYAREAEKMKKRQSGFINVSSGE